MNERNLPIGRRALPCPAPDPAFAHGTGPGALAQICDRVHLDGGGGRLHRIQRLPDRRRDQPGLRQSEPAGHHCSRRNHCRPVFGEGPRHIRPQRDAVTHRQSNCRGQSARGFFEAAQRRARLLLGPPFNRIHRPSFDRRRGRNASHQSAHYLGRTRPALADRTGHGDGGAGSGAVVLHLCRGSSRILRSPQIDPAHLFDRPHPVSRRDTHHRNLAGNAARNPHREGLHPRRHHARAFRPECRGGRARSQQDGSRIQSRQPLDGNSRRMRHCDCHHLWRLSRDRDRRHAGPVFLLHYSVFAGL